MSNEEGARTCDLRASMAVHDMCCETQLAPVELGGDRKQDESLMMQIKQSGKPADGGSA